MRRKIKLIELVKEVLAVVLLILPLVVMSACKYTYDGTDVESNSGISSEQELLIENDVTNSKTTEADTGIYVYVVGEVEAAGVYMLDVNARMYEAIEAAGGFTKEAAKEYINLAKRVSDGERIVVYSKEQVSDKDFIDEAIGVSDSSLVNINTADVDKLMTLPGIGESRANDIIEYREKNGRFESIEDIMKVSGIKQAAFSKIEDLITVN